MVFLTQLLRIKMPQLTFIEANGNRKTVDAPNGVSIMEIAHLNEIDIEGSCGGSLACATCHIIVSPEWYEKVGEPSEMEEDMLDLAFGLTQTSRLSCQIIMSNDLDGMEIRLPSATRNF
jgi:ferredoxin, 2Fe-2S